MTRNPHPFSMRTLVNFVRTKEVPSKITVHHSSVHQLKREFNMYPSKLHGNLWSPKDHADTKEGIKLL